MESPMRDLSEPPSSLSRHIPYPLFVAVWMLPLVLMATAPAGAEGRDFPHSRSHRGRQCAGLERALGVLEWTHFLDRGGWGALFRGHRERAIQRLARRYADRCVSLNQVQVLGTHNSYHIQPDPTLINLYVLFDETAVQWEYTHRPLEEQFELLGIRQIELDVYADPTGGLYAAPFGFQLLLNDFEARIPELEAPGIKVLHVQELDYDTTCQSLVECLGIVKGWSDASPGHLPIMILVEAKDNLVPDPLDLGFTVPIEFGSAEFDDLDTEIRSVFPPEQIITPDEVRGSAPTLEEAVQSRGWPTLSESRGRILFALDNGGSKREAYLEGHPSLMGRVLFTNATPGQPDAAFVKVNEPRVDPDRIRELVRDGYIVRTRADADTLDARYNDTERRDAALASGAQYVSTDYPEPDLAFSEYQVTLPDGAPGRCNPVNAPPGCRSFALDRLD
jgi:hypothetical protein